MSMILTIARHELRRLFLSSLAWSLLAVVQLTLAFVFLTAVQNFIDIVSPRLAGAPHAPGVTSLVISPLCLWAGVLMLGITPLLAMRSFSEEYHTGSMLLLTSAPLSATQIVLGKYLGLAGFLCLMIAMIALMPLSLAIGTHLDWGHLAAQVLGLALLTVSFAAAGLYLSSLTRQPALAAIGGFGALFLSFVFYVAGTAQGTASRLFVYLSHFGHFLPFLRGEFDSRALAYYLLFTLLFLGLTVRQLDGQRLLR